MTLGHAALAAQLTLYIAIAMQYEQRDLSNRFSAAYEAWRKESGAYAPRAILPPFARGIAIELRRRFPPIARPLPQEMQYLLDRLDRLSPLG
jgi:hypothetical protein